jgi:hypothetical protein
MRSQEENKPLYRNAASSISSRYIKNKKRKYEMYKEEYEAMRVRQEQMKATEPQESEREDDKKTDKNSYKIVCIQ